MIKLILKMGNLGGQWGGGGGGRGRGRVSDKESAKLVL